jgi:hypothetical protein
MKAGFRVQRRRMKQNCPSVNLLAVADDQNQNQQDGVVDFVDDPVISGAEAVTILKSAHFLRAHAPGIFRELAEGVIQPLLQFRVPDFPQRLFDRRTDFLPMQLFIHELKNLPPLDLRQLFDF